MVIAHLLAASLLLSASIALPSLPPCAAALARAGVTVPLAFPSDAAYANASRVNDPLFVGGAQSPPFVALPTSAEHVQAALACAAAAHARVGVKGGGHGPGGYSTLADGGAFMMSLESLSLRGTPPGTLVAWADAPAGAIRASGGARWRDVYAFLDAAAPPTRVAAGGLCPTVGLGGYVQGGGLGPLTRSQGLASDALLSATVVLANGSSAASTSSAHNSDLLFALRGGGGGNWGVVMEMTLATHLAAAAYTFTQACFSAATAAEAVAIAGLHAAAALALPRDANADIIYDGSKGEACVWAIVGGNASYSAQVLAPLLKAAPPAPRPVTLEALTFDSLWGLLQVYAVKHGYDEFGSMPWSTRACFVNGSSAAHASFAAALVAPLYGRGNASSLCQVHVLHVGGALADVAPDATAFPWRGAQLMPYASCAWPAGNDGGAAEAARGLALFAESLAVLGCNDSAYVNFQDRALTAAAAMRLNFGANADRLLGVKNRWAPAGETPLRNPQEVGGR